MKSFITGVNLREGGTNGADWEFDPSAFAIGRSEWVFRID